MMSYIFVFKSFTINYQVLTVEFALSSHHLFFTKCVVFLLRQLELWKAHLLDQIAYAFHQGQGLPFHRWMDAIAGELQYKFKDTIQVWYLALNHDQNHEGNLDIGCDVGWLAGSQNNVLEYDGDLIEHI